MLRKAGFRWLVVLTTLAAAGAGTLALGADSAPRQTATLPFDAAVADTAWIDFSIGYRRLRDSEVSRRADDLVLAGKAAWRFRPNVELGLEGEYISRDFSDPELGSPSGLGDLLAWAKYGFPSSGNARFATGGFLSIPTGDEDKFLGTGNLDGGVFASAGALTRGNGFVQAHVGVRTNRDFENRLTHLEGRNSIFTGFGGVYTASADVEVFASLLLETGRYEGVDSVLALSGGARWTLSRSWRIQVLASIGLTDPAPRVSLGAGMVWIP